MASTGRIGVLDATNRSRFPHRCGRGWTLFATGRQGRDVAMNEIKVETGPTTLSEKARQPRKGNNNGSVSRSMLEVLFQLIHSRSSTQYPPKSLLTAMEELRLPKVERLGREDTTREERRQRLKSNRFVPRASEPERNHGRGNGRRGWKSRFDERVLKKV